MAKSTKKSMKPRAASSKSKLKSTNKFNLNAALIVVGILSLTGIYLVWQSFAAEPTSKYDASNYAHCKYFNNIPSTPSKGMKASELPTDGGTWCWERNLKYGLSGGAPTNEVLARKAALAAWDAQHTADWCKWQPDTNPPTIDCSTAGAASTPAPTTDTQAKATTPSSKPNAQTKTTTQSTKSSPTSNKSDGTTASSSPKTNGTR